MEASKTAAGFGFTSRNPLQAHKIIIGIDPGVETGFAIYNRLTKSLELVRSYSITEALERILALRASYEAIMLPIFVRVEDARLRKWFGSSGVEKHQGAGSIKRDCSIWSEFLTRHEIPFEFVAPKNNRTKMDAKLFAQVTGWKGRTNEHARDAGALVFKF